MGKPPDDWTVSDTSYFSSFQAVMSEALPRGCPMSASRFPPLTGTAPGEAWRFPSSPFRLNPYA